MMTTHTIKLNDSEINYVVKRSRKRRRSMSLGITKQGPVVSVPYREPNSNIERFVFKHASWIFKKLKEMQTQLELKPVEPLPDGECIAAFFHERIEIYQSQLQVRCHSMIVANQKSQWGSCSHRGVIRLNKKLWHLPLELVDYVVVHELCHLVHFNHSKAFWSKVATACPDYKIKRRRLSKMGYVLI